MKRLLPLLLALLLSLSGCLVIRIPPDPNYTFEKTTDTVASAPTEEAGSMGAVTDPPPTTEAETDPPLPPHSCTSDPYVNVDKDAFYANYTPACCYQNAVYRTNHSLMSGSIDEQDQEPTLAKNRPMSGRTYIRNTSTLYEDNGNTYCVVDANGNIVNRIYKNGGYVTLEEVAAYVYAFGNIPANYVSNKKDSPSSNPWGVYLRLNNSSFSGDTSKYPYEPELPNISGCGGSLRYFEIDIGTTGTDCDPSYPITDYNNGSKITRGAARIVYARYDGSRQITDPNERYVFYTYNHYNDFQEYLNYEGGWGELFGNITGGGKLSSKTNYNPSPYVSVLRSDLTARTALLSLPQGYYDPSSLLAA